MSVATLPDLYAALEVKPEADAAQIKASYRALVRRFHPDANPHARAESEARIKELTRAFAVLGDAQKRADYDRNRRLSAGHSATPVRGALSTRVRLALGLSSDECAARLGLSQSAFAELETRDSLPTSPVQNRTFVMLLENAAKTLELRGQASDARDLRLDLERKRARQAALR